LPPSERQIARQRQEFTEHGKDCACEVCFGTTMLRPLLEEYRRQKRGDRIRQQKTAQVGCFEHIEGCDVCWPALQAKRPEELCSVGTSLLKAWDQVS